MKKLPQVLLVLTVLAAGIMHGHYHFSRERGLTPGKVTCLSHVSRALRNLTKYAGEKIEHPQAKKKNTIRGGKYTIKPVTPSHGNWDVVERPGDEKEAQIPRKTKPTYNDKLDRADMLINEATIYLRVAALNKELESEYAKKTLKATGEALDILEPLFKKYPENQEIKQRMQSIYKLRHDATKRDHAM